MKWFSVCTGIGGFDIALEKLGHEIVGACEIDEHARSVYSRHFPKVRIWNDATKLDPRELPHIDGICAGFPCQAFSIAGERRGFEDTRGTIFFEILRVAKEKRPRLLFLENVTGLLNHDKGRTFGVMLKALDELGYGVEWRCINGKHFLPQKRPRVFIIGHLREKSRQKILLVGEGKEVDDRTLETPQDEGQRIRGTCVNTIDANYGKRGGGQGQ